MSFTGIKNWFGKIFASGTSDGTTRPDGGTNCYRPVQTKNERSAGNGDARPTPYVHTGFTGMNPSSGQNGFDSGNMYGYQTGGTNAPDNISYMPGARGGEIPQRFGATVRILPLTSLIACYNVIECMKNGETLLVSLDAIANEKENTRCQDMLAGAAFTMNCQVRAVGGRKMVLIVPAGVRVLPEQDNRTWVDPMTYAAPENENPGHTAYTRERRTSRNEAGWNDYREENRSYNPYTGREPAVSGDYSGYGGYGDGQPSSYTEPSYGAAGGTQYGTQYGAQYDAQYGTQYGAQYDTRYGTQYDTQYGAQNGMPAYNGNGYGQAAGYEGGAAVGYGQTMYTGGGYGGGNRY